MRLARDEVEFGCRWRHGWRQSGKVPTRPRRYPRYMPGRANRHRLGAHGQGSPACTPTVGVPLWGERPSTNRRRRGVRGVRGVPGGTSLPAAGDLSGGCFSGGCPWSSLCWASAQRSSLRGHHRPVQVSMSCSISLCATCKAKLHIPSPRDDSKLHAPVAVEGQHQHLVSSSTSSSSR